MVNQYPYTTRRFFSCLWQSLFEEKFDVDQIVTYNEHAI